MGKKNAKTLTKNAKFTIIISCELFFLLALIVFAVISGSWFQSTQNIGDMITLGDISVVWCDSLGQEYTTKTFVIGDTVSGGSVFYKDMYITNTGTNESYLRTKVELFYYDDVNDEWLNAGLYVNPNADPTKWIKTTDGYFYYNVLTEDATIENPKLGCVYPNEVIDFATIFTFSDPLPDLLLNKTIKVMFTCQTIQSNVDEALVDWGDNVPAEWLDNIGVVPDVYMYSTATNRNNDGLVSYDLTANSLAPITLTTKNKGSKKCFIKVDVKVIVSNSLFPSGYISFTTTSNFTRSTNDGKFYCNNIVDAQSSDITLTIQPVLNNAEHISTEGLTYKIEFYIESLEFDEGVTLSHSFFTNAPSSWSIPVA